MRNALLSFAAAFLLIGCGLLSARGQSTRSLDAAARRLDDFQKQSVKVARDEMQREMRGRKPTKEELAHAARIRIETRQDLEGLQESYNSILLKLNDRTAVAPEFVREMAAKVHGHSGRLQSNLRIPETDADESKEFVFGSTDVRHRLRELCSHIFAFLTNPIVENPNVLNVEASAKARESLRAVTDLSESLKSQSD